MTDIYKIFDKLMERKVMFFFQSQQSKFYTMMVHDKKGKEVYLASDNLGDLENQLKSIWGEVLTPKIQLPSPK